MRIGVRTFEGILILIICLPLAFYAKHTQEVAPNLTFVRVRLRSPVKFSRLKPGDMLHGCVIQNAFSGYRVIIPSGSHVDLTVARIRRGAKKPTSLWPWPVRYFLPKYEKLPTFDFVDITLPDGTKVRAHVTIISAIDTTHVDAKTKARLKSVSNTTSSVERKKLSTKGRVSPNPILNWWLIPCGLKTPEDPSEW